MNDKLPAIRAGMEPDTISSDRTGRTAALNQWFGSPIGRALAQALPEVIRMASRPRPAESRPITSQILPSTDGASGMTLSEVEVDMNVPFIRRLTIRSASSWSVAPDVILTEQRNQRRNRWKLRAITAGLLGVAGVVLAHRSGVSLPARLNPAASLPFLTSGPAPVATVKKNPAVTD